MAADSLFPTSGIRNADEVSAPGVRSSRRIPVGTRTTHHACTHLTGRTGESRADALHRMTRIEQSGQSGGNAVAEKRIDLSYNAASQWQTITRYADLAATKLVASSDYAFDAAGRLTALSHAEDATPLAGYTWTYDAANRVTEFTSLLDGTAEYTYDSTDQLTGADYTAGAGLPPAPPDEAFAYDANGNRTKTGYATGDNNLVLSDGTYDYQYDAEGNRTRRTHIASGEVTDYQWDHRNRLTRITIRPTANDPLTTDILYAYDAFNRLVRVTLHATDNGPLTTDTFHVYDGERWERGNAGDHLALVFDGNGDLTNRYVYGPAVDQILADEQLDSLTTPGEVLWPLTDNLGTVRDLAAYDDATGDTTVVNHRTYTAFGQILDETDPTIQHRFAYTAREWDEHAGLYHYRARWYDPAPGRFLSEDPIGFEPGDPNLQRYVGNGVTNTTDPSGLERVNYPRADLTPPAPNLPIWIDPYLPLLTQQREQTETLRKQAEALWLELDRDLRRPEQPQSVAGTFEPGEKGIIPEAFIGRWLPRNRDSVLRGIRILRPDGSEREVPDVTELRGITHKIGATGSEWWRGILAPGVVAGPTGTGPCVGAILIPPDPSLDTFVFHFAPRDDIRLGLIRAGALRFMSVDFGAVPVPPERGYRAVLCGGEWAAGAGNLAAVINVLAGSGFDIAGYVPTVAMYVDHMGTIYDAKPSASPRAGYIDQGWGPRPIGR